MKTKQYESTPNSQPPCEAVSWNGSYWSSQSSDGGQPPCEAVSWNAFHKLMGFYQTVSLLVRLWVEIHRSMFWYHGYTRQPPCEAVSWNTNTLFPAKLIICQPPCEAVSWNWNPHQNKATDNSQPPCEAVSWNVGYYRRTPGSASQPPCEAVSWNPINCKKSGRYPLSASLWGCELKYS